MEGDKVKGINMDKVLNILLVGLIIIEQGETGSQHLTLNK
jgi:hypothetical protein